MPPYQEEEIESISSSISDAPFIIKIRKSQRLIQLPQRYKVEESVHPSTLRKRRSQNTGKSNIKKENRNS
jgi:hypothetical protein